MYCQSMKKKLCFIELSRSKNNKPNTLAHKLFGVSPPENMFLATFGEGFISPIKLRNEFAVQLDKRCGPIEFHDL